MKLTGKKIDLKLEEDLSKSFFKLALWLFLLVAITESSLLIFSLFQEKRYEPLMNIVTFDFGLLAFAVANRYLTHNKEAKAEE